MGVWVCVSVPVLITYCLLLYNRWVQVAVILALWSQAAVVLALAVILVMVVGAAYFTALQFS